MNVIKRYDNETDVAIVSKLPEVQHQIARVCLSQKIQTSRLVPTSKFGAPPKTHCGKVLLRGRQILQRIEAAEVLGT
jgi:hypothetical protein